MLNIIKADLYRIFHGKGLYITLEIFLVFLVFRGILTEQLAEQVDISSMMSDVKYDEIEINGEVFQAYKPPEYTGKTAPFVLASGTDSLIYFILPFIVFIAAADFSHSTVKNMVSGGSVRIKYYISKIVLTAGACVVVWLIDIIVPVITVTVMHGFGGDFSGAFVSDVLKVYLPQLYLLFTYACIGIFLAFTFKRTAVLNTVFIAFSVLPGALIDIISSYDGKFADWVQYDLLFNMKSFAHPSEAIPPDLTRVLVLGGIYILACTAVGIMLFRRSEIK